MVERLNEHQLRNIANQVNNERQFAQRKLYAADQVALGADLEEDLRFQETVLRHFERGLRVALGEELPYVETVTGSVHFDPKLPTERKNI
jgi:hypothetical protein